MKANQTISWVLYLYFVIMRSPSLEVLFEYYASTSKIYAAHGFLIETNYFGRKDCEDLFHILYWALMAVADSNTGRCRIYVML